ncbi:hypothetical protein B0J13DRAFT_604376 [Dactylonectria estremocensis]|uniref:Uncharacterized protein n=1 Tax=Dactylonectria estremocensis TaxID=1079267 RepID=A0A9P9F4G5_9HYPO|nr:hypothetical protein B0J13DRAFT_604376 [Dactylonectria estremocensis]
MNRSGQDQISSEEPKHRHCRPVFKTTFRAASPCLRRLPLDTKDYALPEMIQVKEPTIKERTRGILNRYGLLDKETEVRIAYRVNLQVASKGLPTLLIVTKWGTVDAGRKWTQAAEDMVALVDETFQTPAHMRMVLDVEMIAPRLVLPVYFDTVRNRPDLQAAWPRISSIVSDRLEAHEATFDKMNSLSLFRVGNSPELEQNPITVYISVDFESDETQWDTVVDDIRSNCRDEGWTDLSIHIEHNEIFTGLLFDCKVVTGTVA